MSTLRFTFLTLMPLLACNSSGDSDTGASSSDTSTTDPGTATSDTATTVPGTATTATTSDTTSDEPPTTGNTAATEAEPETTTGPGDTTSDDSTTGDTGTTGEPAYCNGWQPPYDDPHIDLFDLAMQPLTDGATLPLECGGQGLFMFGLYPKFGGFMPTSDYVDFAVTVDVDGFNNNPDGHFYSADPVGYYVGCEPLDGGVSGVIPVFPLDNLDDLAALDGKPARVNVFMQAGDVGVNIIADLVLSVKKDDSWAFCGG